MKCRNRGALYCVLILFVSFAGCGAPGAQSAPTGTSAVPTAAAVTVTLTAAPEGQSAQQAADPTQPLSGLVIGIDPGHQARKNTEQEPIAPNAEETKNKVSAGATGTLTGTKEYQINLEVAIRLQTLLTDAGATVVMTRTGNDVDISNAERAGIMNAHAVDLAVRLHCNGSDNAESRGAYLLIPGEGCTDWYDQNLRAAEAVLSCYCAKTGLPATDARVVSRDDQTGFNWCTRPVITIEMGYLTNADDEAYLASEAHWAVMAGGLYDGILAYFRDK